jgi:hypothetical protein
MRLLACLCVVAILGACRQETAIDQPPELGASEGEVRLAVEGDLTSGASVVVQVHADDPEGVVGGSCLRLDRWEPSFGPLPDWLIDTHSGRQWSFDDRAEPSEYDDASAQCPATRVTLPTTLSFTSPALEDGTYQISYVWTIVRARPPGRPGETFRADYTLKVESP